VIEGLRLLPFTADKPNLNCQSCMNGTSDGMAPLNRITRQRQACGLLPRLPGVNAAPVHGVDYSRDVCPGYLTSLPEVQETVLIRPQWLKGLFGVYVRGSDVCEDLAPALNAQGLLESAIIAKQNHDAEERAREAEEERRRHGR
jgi:hypothetical protein